MVWIELTDELIDWMMEFLEETLDADLLQPQHVEPAGDIWAIMAMCQMFHPEYRTNGDGMWR